MMKIGVINYGVGNINSVFNSISRIDKNVKIIQIPSELKNFDKIILPGTGSFYKCIELLKAYHWFDEIKEHVYREKYIFGICLGMQLFASIGSEGNENYKIKGFGFIDGQVKSLLSLGCKFKMPLIGWNEIKIQKKSILLNEVKNNADVYFVNSYSFVPKFKETILTTTNYDIDFVSSVEQDNIFGTQFHPEKSSHTGRQILKNFINA